jgi:hypothetical protein
MRRQGEVASQRADVSASLHLQPVSNLT